ncbi:MAG: hypothetical protein J0I09_12110 [Sphingobacteriia bacterium]|nr:hypothetical protein [Sphingobacteriia bacterium]
MKNSIKRNCLSVIGLLLSSISIAQTTDDVIMMNKKQWCNGLTYTSSQWKEYWEGTFKRDNANIGSITTQSLMFMSNYGISNTVNIMAGIPYMVTKASAGTLHGQKGLQDVSLAVKWKALTIPFIKGKLSLFGVGEFSTPATNYEADFLPLSIGLGTTNFSTKLISNYQKNYLNIRLSGAYVWRSNISIDRTSYYTTGIVYSNQVNIPDAANFNLAIGLHKKYLLADAILYNMTTLGGFDMRKNDMPFPSNRMNSTGIGVNIKYTLPSNTHISFVGVANYVLAGRNVGQATSFTIGCFYANSFIHKTKATNSTSNKN